MFSGETAEVDPQRLLRIASQTSRTDHQPRAPSVRPPPPEHRLWHAYKSREDLVGFRSPQGEETTDPFPHQVARGVELVVAVAAAALTEVGPDRPGGDLCLLEDRSVLSLEGRSRDSG